jgi:putative hemolysin
MITLDDMLSDVVGELDDDSNTGIKGSTRRDDGSWLLDGSFPAHETRELLGIADLPGEREGHFESVGGFVMEQLGHIPRTGETVTVDGYRIEVVDMDGHRIDKIMVYEVQIESDGADSIKDTN